MSSVEYEKLFPGKELLFRGNDYSSTNLPFKGRAPLMWPTVTRNYISEIEKSIKNGKTPEECSYLYKNKTYYIGRSAFAKDMPWKFEGFGDDGCINISLASSPVTKKMYPFDFRMDASFGIENGSVFIKYAVKNNSTEEMFFSMGNHIGINIPFDTDTDIDSLVICSSGTQKRKINEHTTFADEYIDLSLQSCMRLDHPENLFNMVTSGYSYKDNFFSVEDKNSRFEIKNEVINPDSTAFELPDKNELYYTTYGCKDSGFICTEPWIGGINSLNTGKGLIKLKPNGCFTWKITLKWEKRE